MRQRVALITGASSGIGLLTAVELARREFRVVATMRNPERKERLLQAAEEAGVADGLDVRRLDITETATLPGVIAEVVRDHARIDVLLNNAGFAMAGFAEDMKLGEIRRQFETNFFGHVAMTQAVLPTMRAQGSGHILMVSSIAGRAPAPVIGTYAASKFALEGWSEALRLETHSLGIRVVLVEPGSFQTDIWERNAQLGERSLNPDSPNYARGRRFAEHVRKRIVKRDARRVAEKIARIAEDPNPRLRYLIGPDAHAQFWIRALAPWKLYERLVTKRVGID